MSKADSRSGPNPSQLVDRQIAALGDWRGKMLARLRKLILEAVPDITEEWKWNTGVWTHNGLVCSAGSFKDHVKLNEGDEIDAPALKELVRGAVALNKSASTKK